MSSELKQIEAKVAVLEAEVAHLRKREAAATARCRWLTLLGIAGVAVVGLSPRASTQDQTTSPNIVCNSLTVVGRNNQPRVTLGTNERGGYVALRGNNNVEQWFGGVNEAGGMLGLRRQDGIESYISGINEAGGFTSHYGMDRREKAFVGVSGNGDSGVCEFNRGNYR